eukprot:TRINITY_DN7290_c0_g1_i7.p1 TRINITY_DN7290_c0_g1~~TRINITY_DN7290_c0_g1_i7.p1  ORF type:complete len:423 (-),score=39.50 TRINITY_DN7290_c0_g1_i7:93-1361(-)
MEIEQSEGNVVSTNIVQKSEKFSINCLNPQVEIKCVKSVVHEYAVVQQPRNGNFLKGVKFSPDGSCLITASDDRLFRLYSVYPDQFQDDTNEVDTWFPYLRAASLESVYDYCWYPWMNIYDARTCCFAFTCKGHPVHLMDALSGEIRCTYRAYDHLDELVSAHSIGYSLDALSLFCGYNKFIRVFDLCSPGREPVITIKTHQKDHDSVPGIISCFSFSEQTQIMAAGSYVGSIGLFDMRQSGEELQFVIERWHKGGITQLKFLRDGYYLISGARKDASMFCWDIRNIHSPLYQFQRDTDETNQRIQFDVESGGRYLLSGSQNGKLNIYDLWNGECVYKQQFVDDVAVNGVSCHPSQPLIALASGQRNYEQQNIIQKEDGEENEQKENLWFSNCLQVLRYKMQECFYSIDQYTTEQATEISQN